VQNEHNWSGPVESTDLRDPFNLETLRESQDFKLSEHVRGILSRSIPAGDDLDDAAWGVLREVGKFIPTACEQYIHRYHTRQVQLELPFNEVGRG
jgi:hypothetical protein